MSKYIQFSIFIAALLNINEARAEPLLSCEHGSFVEFTTTYICTDGLEERALNTIEKTPMPGRMIQWTASNIQRSGGELADQWPPGVSFIRISQRRLREPRPPLYPSDVPNAVEERMGPVTFYWHKTLKFRDENVMITCSPSFTIEARTTYSEDCSVIATYSDNMRITINVLTGVFYDGGPGWPTLLEDHDPSHWQDALDETSNYLDLLILSKQEK